MDLREKVARAIRRQNTGTEEGWLIRLPDADAAIAVMTPVAQPDDEARWVVEQAVRLLAIPSAHRTDGKSTTLSFAVDSVCAELLRVRNDLGAK